MAFQSDIDAAEKVRKALELPLPADRMDIGGDDTFDPWEIFPVFYGSYSGAFDELALSVLIAMRDRKYRQEDLAHELFREYLCRSALCDYGTSPRVCFPTCEFKPLLPALIEKWSAFARLQWGDEWADDVLKGLDA